MAHIGHPLIGDKRYGGPSVLRFPELVELHGRKGHLLNAEMIEFNERDGKKRIINSHFEIITN
jgi:23S rRNA-/tRNA-specific pseudouridylate synthase